MDELTQALMRGHESLYATSPAFRTTLDGLVRLLPLWVAGIAAQAEQDLGAEYNRYIEIRRASGPSLMITKIPAEEWGNTPLQASPMHCGLDGHNWTQEEVRAGMKLGLLTEAGHTFQSVGGGVTYWCNVGYNQDPSDEARRAWWKDREQDGDEV